MHVFFGFKTATGHKNQELVEGKSLDWELQEACVWRLSPAVKWLTTWFSNCFVMKTPLLLLIKLNTNA